MFTIRDSLSTDVTAFRVSYDAFVDDVQARCSRLCQSLMQEVAQQIQSINFHGFYRSSVSFHLRPVVSPGRSKACR